MAFRRSNSVDEQHKRVGADRPLLVITPSDATKRAQGRNALDSSKVPDAGRAGWEQAGAEVAAVAALLA